MGKDKEKLTTRKRPAFRVINIKTRMVLIPVGDTMAVKWVWPERNTAPAETYTFNAWLYAQEFGNRLPDHVRQNAYIADENGIIWSWADARKAKFLHPPASALQQVVDEFNKGTAVAA